MTKALHELQTQLLNSADESIKLDVFEEWMRLKADFSISIEIGSDYAPFRLSNYPYIAALFENIVEVGNQQLIKLFFNAKLIDMESLMASLYPEAVHDKAEDSVFFKCISYDFDRKLPVFLDVCFEQVLESELPNTISSFKELHIPTIERLDRDLSEKLLVYLANKKFLDLTAEVAAFPEEKRNQQALLLQISSLLFNQQALSENQINFLKKFNNSELLNYFTNIINDNNTGLDEINNSLDSPNLREIFSEQNLLKLVKFFYINRIQPCLENEEKNLLIFAKKADLIGFEKSWETFLYTYKTYQKKMAKEFNFSNRIFSIFRETVKGGNTQIASLILKENININTFYTNSKNRDEPMEAYNMLALAAFYRNQAMVAFLLDNGININFSPQTAKGDYVSPLAIAIQKECPEIVKLLLEKKITIWDKSQKFTHSPILAAIISDYQNAKESAYYSTQLFNELKPELILELMDSFFARYFAICESYSTQIAQWVFSFLINKSYLNLEEMFLKIAGDSDVYSDYFIDTLLEKVLRLNLVSPQKISKFHKKFLSHFKRNLSTLIMDQINEALFSSSEIEQLVNHPIIFGFLNTQTQELLRNTNEINEYKTQPLTLSILKKIYESLDICLRGEKDKLVSKNLNNILFYHELRRFSDLIEESRKSPTLTSENDKLNLELNTDEIESLWVIIEDFKREKANKNQRYQQICTWAVKKLCSTSTLNVRIAKSESASVVTEILPGQYQEKINQIKQVANQLQSVCIDGEAVLAFMDHLLNDRSSIEQFFREEYGVYCFQYKKDQKEYNVALHTENLPRGDLVAFNNFINRLLKEYIGIFGIAHRAGKSKEFFGQFSGLCIEGRLRNCFKWIANLNDLPAFDEIMQKATLQYKAYTKVMEPNVLTDIKNFPTNDDNDYDEEDLIQAIAFIAPRIVGTQCFFESEEGNERVARPITAEDVEYYLQNILIYNEKNDFVFLEDPDPIVGYEIVADAKAIAVYIEQTPEKQRLNPTIVENLLLSYIEGPLSKKTKTEVGFVKTSGNYTIETAFKKIDFGNDNPPWVVFQVTRDSQKDDENKNLPFINEVILAFLNENPEENMTLLMPMAQCRSHFGIKKRHYVLVEITIQGANKEIFIHNSQSDASTWGYSNCLKFDDLMRKGFKFIKHNTYNQQEDGFSCGLFVYRYIQSILESGNSQQLKLIRASLASPGLSLDGMINDNLSLIADLQERRVVAASENFPWERKELERSLAVNYAKNLDLDFPDQENNDLEGSLAAANAPALPKSSFFAKSLNKLPEPINEGIEQKLNISR